MASDPSKLSDAPDDLRARIDGLAVPVGALGVALILAGFYFLVTRSLLFVLCFGGSAWAFRCYLRFGPDSRGASGPF